MEELNKGYQNFLTSLIKAHITSYNMLNQEIAIFTNYELTDSATFMLFAFSNSKKNINPSNIQQCSQLREYITTNPKNGVMKLTFKGQKLKKHLEIKLKNQVAMLAFNNITPKELAKLSTTLKRFEKFWNLISFYEEDVANA